MDEPVIPDTPFEIGSIPTTAENIKPEKTVFKAIWDGFSGHTDDTNGLPGMAKTSG